MKISAALSTIVAFASFGTQLQVSGHGYLVQPLAKFIDKNIDITQYSSTIDSNKLFPGGTFNTAPELNIKSFLEHYKKSEYKSLKAMIDDNQELVSSDATAECGFTDPDKTNYGALNDTIVFGRSPDVSIAEGFVHPGPCETWCDDNQVQQDMNCDTTYNPKSGGGGAPMPIKTAACANAKRLTFYWIGMHGPQWQVYVNCVNINGGGGSSPSTSTTPESQSTPSSNTTPSTTTDQATTPPATPATPSSQNDTPEVETPSTPNTQDDTPEVETPSTPNTQDDTPEVETPAATPAPVVTTATPSSDVGNEASKCLRRFRS
ncbi:hypothetical protein PHYBOEH_010212 [Phytophthora boehmeriae]|uniref:Uncharacterized protein n=1 Tax=Phytophthora boehmeriae TaxID=109152 RepID=A0A8T1VRL4_9STRA|nr:hypothetical protein PHYBOEH_010212 [Phytophthora boehmeriae]